MAIFILYWSILIQIYQNGTLYVICEILLSPLQISRLIRFPYWPSIKEVMSALAVKLAETEPRSSILRLRFQKYNSRAPSQKCDTGDRGAPGIAPGSSVPWGRRVGLLSKKLWLNYCPARVILAKP